MKKKFMFMFACVLGVAVAVLAGLNANVPANADEKTSFKIGIIQYVEHDALDLATQGFQDELRTKMTEAGKTVTFDVQNGSANTAIVNTIASTFAVSDKDLIMANATPAAQAMKSATDTKPILFTSVTDAEVANLVASNAVPGGNVSGTSDLGPIDDQISLMQTLIPGLNKVVFFYTTSEDNSLAQLQLFKTLCAPRGITVVEKGITEATATQINSTFTQMKADSSIQAVYIPTDNLIANVTDSVHAANTDQNVNLPVFCGEINMSNGCGIATYGVDYYELGKQTGQMAFDILCNGADISTMAVQYQDVTKTKLTVNTKVAKDIGFTLSQEFIDSADVVFDGSGQQNTGCGCNSVSGAALGIGAVVSVCSGVGILFGLRRRKNTLEA